MTNLFLTTIEDALQQSRATIKRYYRQRIIVESKADASPVTEADRTVESQIRQIISQRHPDHGIIGEEHGSNQNLADYKWVIDPIDGTKSFISGMPTFGTLVGLTHNERPKLGVIDMPILDERWIGTIGEKTTQPVACLTSNSWPKLPFTAPNLKCLIQPSCPNLSN